MIGIIADWHNCTQLRLMQLIGIQSCC